MTCNICFSLLWANGLLWLVLIKFYWFTGLPFGHQKTPLFLIFYELFGFPANIVQ